MKTAFLFIALITLSNFAFANEVDLICRPKNSVFWLAIKLFRAKPGQEVLETSDFRVLGSNRQVIIEATNAVYQSQMDRNGVLTSVKGSLGRSGSFDLQLNVNGTGVLKSSIFAPGMTYPNGTRVSCSQSSPRPALTGSN